MSVISIIFLLLLIFVIFIAIIWLAQKVSKTFVNWSSPANTSPKETKTSEKIRGEPSTNNLAGKMVRQQNRKSQRQRNKAVPTEANESGVQYTPDGPIFHARHYRSSHITDNLVNEPHSYQTNNGTYGKESAARYRTKQNAKKRTQNRQSQSKGKKMMDSIADSYSQSMQYSEGYQQALKRSKK
ncbi:hypothetical protein [Ligilactobacillus pobuzihii]|uniref:hypothetical protein n=1 Tax=Ligilactobacillus pobuzihii TaxID=449659 RepID=UPI00036CB783|nr:hypothetical protein [Ligilactobacillus pobuzihii]GEN47715.1 hypothetical protein LPO01_05070 [Ligilactobacillus pobuzihii]